MFQMEAELEQFHKKSIQLELTISDLKLKLKATDKERQKEMQRVRVGIPRPVTSLPLGGRDELHHTPASLKQKRSILTARVHPS